MSVEVPIPLSFWSALTVVPNLIAIAPSVSLGLTVYVLPLGLWLADGLGVRVGDGWIDWDGPTLEAGEEGAGDALGVGLAAATIEALAALGPPLPVAVPPDGPPSRARIRAQAAAIIATTRAARPTARRSPMRGPGSG